MVSNAFQGFREYEGRESPASLKRFVANPRYRVRKRKRSEFRAPMTFLADLDFDKT